MAHELVHLVEITHNSEFWSKVETILPDCGDRVRWLAANGVLKLDISRYMLFAFSRIMSNRGELME